MGKNINFEIVSQGWLGLVMENYEKKHGVIIQDVVVIKKISRAEEYQSWFGIDIQGVMKDRKGISDKEPLIPIKHIGIKMEGRRYALPFSDNCCLVLSDSDVDVVAPHSVMMPSLDELIHSLQLTGLRTGSLTDFYDYFYNGNFESPADELLKCKNLLKTLNDEIMKRLKIDKMQAHVVFPVAPVPHKGFNLRAWLDDTINSLIE